MNPEPDIVSDEQRASLATKLKRLLDDFAKLRELDSPDVEPVSTEWLVRSYGSDT